MFFNNLRHLFMVLSSQIFESKEQIGFGELIGVLSDWIYIPKDLAQ